MITIANDKISDLLERISGYSKVLEQAANDSVAEFYEKNRTRTYKVLFFEWSRNISDKKILQRNFLYINYLTNQYFYDNDKLEKLERVLKFALDIGSDITLDFDNLSCLDRYEFTKKGLGNS